MLGILIRPLLNVLKLLSWAAPVLLSCAAVSLLHFVSNAWSKTGLKWVPLDLTISSLAGEIFLSYLVVSYKIFN